jgi:peptide/nickel transport system permease protein
MQRLSYIGWRVLQSVPIALGVTLITFLLVHLIPGDPARTILGTHASPHAVKALRHQWGLDRSLPDQYWTYLSRMLRGNFGESLFFGRSIASVIGTYFPPTLWLIIYSAILSVLISVPLATLAAIRKDRFSDHAVRIGSQIGLGAPPPWVGLILILLLGLKVRAFPVGGYGDGFTGHLGSMFLPSLTIAVGIAPVLIRSLRARLLEVLGADYITTARSKGLRERRVLFAHALRNAAIASITVLGLNIAWLVSGTVVVERVFGIPGLGGLLVDSVLRRDFPLIQGLALTFALMIVVINLLTDVARSVLDPNLRRG